MKQEFTLHPFEISNLFLAIDGAISYQQSLLNLSYHLQGDLTHLLLPSPGSAPSRQSGLWEATCLEFFLAIEGQAAYWEFNLSPNGNWQVFHLDDYRQGLRTEAAFDSLPFIVKKTPDTLNLALSIDLNPLFPPATSLEMSITAVIQTQQGDYSYWALQHTGQEADFHRRADFKIHL